MARIVFDSFEPSPNCLEENNNAKKQVQKTCSVEMTFHIEGDKTQDPPAISFIQSSEGFALDNSPGSENTRGLLVGQNFEPKSPQVLSNILYSIGLLRYFTYVYALALEKTKYSGPAFLNSPLTRSLRDFILVGDTDSADYRSNMRQGELLKQLFALQDSSDETKKTYYFTLIQSLTEAHDNRYYMRPDDMRPRIDWLSGFLNARGRLRETLAPLPPGSALKADFERWIDQALLHIATGSGDAESLGTRFKALAMQAQEQGNIPAGFKDPDALFLARFLSPEFLKGLKPAGKAEARLLDFQTRLYRGAFQAGILRAGQGRLQGLVAKELREARLSPHWLEDPSRLRELGEAFAAGLSLAKTSDGLYEGRLSPALAKQGVLSLQNRHGIQEREYGIGALAVLEEMLAPAQGIPLHLSDSDRKEMEKLRQSLQRQLRRSLAQTNKVLPWVEAGLCVAGGILAGTGGGLQQRPLTLSGSTITGLGCGALAAHFIPNRNPYITDSASGLVGAALAFTAAWFATQGMEAPSGGLPLDGRNPVSGWGP